eukprot:29205-Pelagococcus_subviridis.AAC.3
MCANRGGNRVIRMRRSTRHAAPPFTSTHAGSSHSCMTSIAADVTASGSAKLESARSHPTPEQETENDAPPPGPRPRGDFRSSTGAPHAAHARTAPRFSSTPGPVPTPTPPPPPSAPGPPPRWFSFGNTNSATASTSIRCFRSKSRNASSIGVVVFRFPVGTSSCPSATLFTSASITARFVGSHMSSRPIR